MMTEDEKYNQIKINDYIDRSFRDIADQDYIASRALFEQGLELQALWYGLQAIEKYVKAILLYNRISAKRLGHDIVKAITRMKTEISDIDFDIPNNVDEFLVHLNQYGPDRYFETEFVRYGRELIFLDRSVWFIRRYCFNVREVHLPGGETTNNFDDNLKRIETHDPERPWTAHISGGYIESVLEKKRSKKRKTLVWKNLYFGSNKKRSVRIRSGPFVSNSSLLLFPEIIRELEPLVQFSKATKDRFGLS